MLRKLEANLSMFVLLGGIAGFVMSPNVLQEDDSRSIYGGNSCPFNDVDITNTNCTTTFGAGCTGTVGVLTSTSVGSIKDVVPGTGGCVEEACPKDDVATTACQQNCGDDDDQGGGGGGGRQF